MQILNLRQGSPEWMEHRRTKFNASDAPAMLSESPYTSRADLIRRMATGIVPEVDAATQRRFDAGHQVEGLLRQRAEQIVGEPLHPFVAVADFDGRLSASFDGCTFVGDETAECKLLNARLRAAFDDMETIAPEYRETSAAKSLPIDYRIQMEQQARIAGAVRVLFLAGELRDDGTLGDVLSCWYYPDSKLWQRILAGWKQFEQDVSAYVPAEPAAPAAVAAPMESLPAVSIRMEGTLAVRSNLQALGPLLRDFIAKIPDQPTTDDDFVKTEAACKALKKLEDHLDTEEESALAELAPVEEMRRLKADLHALARTTRLQREKLVKARKDQLRLEQVQRGRAALAKHLQGLNQRLGGGFMPDVLADFAGVISGKKTMASIIGAVDDELARAKIAANEIADRMQANLQAIDAAGKPGLFPDRSQLALKAPEDCAAQIEARVAAEHRREEAAREKIRQEEAARIERETQARLAAEQRQREEAEAREREAEEARQRAAASSPATAPASAPIASPAPSSQAEAPVPAAAATVVPITRGKPTLKLGDINARLAKCKVTAEDLAGLGFPAADRERSAVLYHEADFTRIVDSLVAHLRMVQQQAPVAQAA